MGENIEMAREDVGVVGKRLPGVVGADESSSFRLDVIGARCSLRATLLPFAAVDSGSVGASLMLSSGRVVEAAELERERVWAVGTTGSWARGAGLGWGRDRRRDMGDTVPRGLPSTLDEEAAGAKRDRLYRC